MQLFFSFCILLFYMNIYGQPVKIEIIDVYGNRKIDTKTIRSQLGINEGDSIEQVVEKKQFIIEKLQQLPGVVKADLALICCDDSANNWIVFAGVTETPGSFIYNTAPTAKILLPAEITNANDSFFVALMAAVQKGNGDEDRSQGHSLMKDPASRRQQQKFILYAQKYFPLLQQVLHTSADPAQRAIAAMVIAYAEDKNKMVKELIPAVYDADDDTRNNATRAIAVLLEAAERKPGLLKEKIPAEPFIDMINSVIWTDRNKGLAVLLPLTRDTATITLLKQKALPSLYEMAAWKNPGHALYAYLIVGRMAGFHDEQVMDTFYTDKRSIFLQEMINKIK